MSGFSPAGALTGASTLDALAGYAVATSFPGSPSTGDRCYRTDRNTEYVYDGTRWLSTQEYSISFALGVVSASASVNIPVPFKGTYSIYITNIDTTVYLTTGTGNWSAIVNWVNSANSSTALHTQTTGTTVTWLHATTAVNAVLDANAVVIQLAPTENSGTVTCYSGADIRYRLVG